MSEELDKTIQEIKKQFGDGSIMRLGEARKVDVDSIPTGSISLDIALGTRSTAGKSRGNIRPGIKWQDYGGFAYCGQYTKKGRGSCFH